MRDRYDVAVIGGGIAGVTAAAEAARHDVSVALVASEALGGRGGWSSLLPSKVLIHAADERAAANLPAPTDLGELTARMHRVSGTFNAQLADTLRPLGVDVLRASAAFAGPHALALQPVSDDEGVPVRLTFARAIIASGSVPVFPASLRPDGQRIIAPRAVPRLASLPPTMLVIGGGVTGAEFTHAFAALGVRVTWLVDQFGVLPGFDRRLAHLVHASMTSRGVRIVEGEPVASVTTEGEDAVARLADGRTVTADRAFVAIGRSADLASLNLAAAGLEAAGVEPFRSIAVDAFARTAVPHILAAGDVTGSPLSATKALAQAFTAGRVAAGADVAPLDPTTWIDAVYTSPQVAQVGLTPSRATAAGRAVTVHRVPATASLEYHLLDDAVHAGGDSAEVTVVADAADRRVLGACAFGPRAAEQLAAVALALRLRATLDDLAAVVPAYPTLSELPFIAARTAPIA